MEQQTSAINRLKTKIQAHTDSLRQVDISEEQIHEHIELTKIEFLKGMDNTNTNFLSLIDTLSSMNAKVEQEFTDDAHINRIKFMESQLGLLKRELKGRK
jgi:hypothetical protein